MRGLFRIIIIMETPDLNDTYNDLLLKIAKNLYAKALAVNPSSSIEPTKGTDAEILKNCVINSALL